MKRTIKPEERKKILQEDISLNIKENNSLQVEVKLKIKGKGFPPNSRIILEAYNRIGIERIELGEFEDYKEETQTHDLPFELPLRAKINFRLKIIDPGTYKLLGYAENLKEEKYAKSLLEFSTDDEKVENIYKIDFENLEHPILYLNPKLKNYAEQLRPVIAEMALKDVLMHLLVVDEEESLEDHKWFKFAANLVPYENDNDEADKDEKIKWINEVLRKFSKDKVINNLIKIFGKGK